MCIHAKLRALSALVLIVAAPQALAESAFPEQTITVVAPFAPGGAADTVARILAPALSTALEQTVIVENHSGAGGALGSAAVATSDPDGYTLLVNLGPPHQTVHLFSDAISYDPVTDFSPISLVATAPQVLVVPGSSPYTTAAEFLEAAQTGELTYGTSGMGTSQHLAGLLLASSQGASLVHVSYRSGAEALTGVLGEQTDAAIVVMSNVLPYVRSGQLRALGVLEADRAQGAPDIPTLSEGIGQDFSVPTTWVGVLGPAGLPTEIVERLEGELAAIMGDEEVVARLQNAGYEPGVIGTDDFARQLAESEEMYRELVSSSGIQPE